LVGEKKGVTTGEGVGTSMPDSEKIRAQKGELKETLAYGREKTGDGKKGYIAYTGSEGTKGGKGPIKR